MKNKTLQKLSVAALVASVLPLAAFLPALLNLTLSEGVRNIWAGANIAFILMGLSLSIVCMQSQDKKSIVNIVSTIISAFLLLIIIGIGVLALFVNFLQ
ncbi:MAG TPA: hypothetical protein PK513_08340 [Alphaproteobacteria bacterium]|nr:hypothetical protein [Alphaproteobacteria bacterium]